MRLINTASRELHEFIGDNVPPYAMLSHRWASGEAELSYKDYRKNMKTDRSGYKKIHRFCDLAQSQGHQWAWVDTCCIDKRSSAELSEAINSMFKWYQGAKICIAYLSDVNHAPAWCESDWWRRGWTLQELIAPREVLFYTSDWSYIGAKTERYREIASLTRIPRVVLTTEILYKHFTVAQKMSWAARRSTTRVEDTAYCLLGLFHINMPLLYGEGDKAFQRLQLAILEKYSDLSLLAWNLPSEDPSLCLAESPFFFADCANLEPEQDSSRPWNPWSEEERAAPPRVTSWGIEFRGHARELQFLSSSSTRKNHPVWAVPLTTAWAGRTRELPRTLVLVQSGPPSNGCKRLECVPVRWSECQELLSRKYKVGDLVRAKQRFYLKHDSDFSYFYQKASK